jgi:hypothetical protein
MLAVDMTAFQLDTGEMVEFKEEINCTVKDIDALYDFLEERGDGNLVKINLEIGKVPKSILSKIVQKVNEEFGILAESKLTIHHSTLRSYIKNLCGIGGQSEAEIPLAALDEDMVKTFTYYKTKVK